MPGKSHAPLVVNVTAGSASVRQKGFIETTTTRRKPMKKIILAPVAAIALSLGAATPAQAADFTIGSSPLSILIGLLLPAVQKVR
jgi:hypothetical protein